jgi:two-component system chemotaxis response regulator CheY
MRVLIVEDDFTSRRLLRTILAPYADCDIAVDGAEAVKAFHLATEEKRPYDLILLDIMMPEMDGQAVLKEIRRIEDVSSIHGLMGVKIIMTTALDDRRNIIEAFRSQCEAYLIKPIDKSRLLCEIQSLGLQLVPRSQD